MTLKISISGIRGIYGRSLTDEVCRNFIRAYATFLKKGTVVVGMDTRPSSSAIKKIVIAELVNLDFNVLDADVSPTPTIGFAVRALRANGGIVITASHNPEEWNGLKLMREDGTFLNEKEGNKVLTYYKSGKFISAKKKGKIIKSRNKIYSLHINKILKSVNAKKIRNAHFKVALDSVNGAGSIITLQLLKKLGCQISAINTKTKAPFPHPPEPTPENLQELCRKVIAERAEIGFAQDPDADRLALVDDKGKAISEEYTLVISALAVLKKNKKNHVIVTNLSTTSALDEIAQKLKAKVIRTKVGEAHVVGGMKKYKAIIGGEGNGGVIYPKINYNRDSLAGIALTLELLAEENISLSKIIEELPVFESAKNKIEFNNAADADKLISALKKKHKNDRMDETEGIKIYIKNGWVHVRPSNTEPIIRIIAEARTKDQAEKIAQDVKDLYAHLF